MRWLTIPGRRYATDPTPQYRQRNCYLTLVARAVVARDGPARETREVALLATEKES